MPLFTRYLGIDYSGAQTCVNGLKGLRLYSATPDSEPVEILPPPGRLKYWTRCGLAGWLVAALRENPPTLVGIDHGFSFPIAYFDAHGLPPHWPGFLDDFQRHWPTDEPIYVDFVRDGLVGRGADRKGNPRWRRLVERRCRAKSVFHFDVQGSVAKSTHAGLPWLRHLRQELGDRIQFWPFDGWQPMPGKSVIAEVYPSLWNRSYPVDDRTPDQHDAYSIVRWMREADVNGTLVGHFDPGLPPHERAQAAIEGWILGVR